MRIRRDGMRMRGVAWALLLALGIVAGAAQAAAVPLAAANGAAAPLTAQLAVLSTPTLGGGGQVLWAAVADRELDGAELSFILHRPGGAPDLVTTLTLSLAQGKVTERIYAFDTLLAGEYTVTARVWGTEGGKAWAREDVRKIYIVPANDPQIVMKQQILATGNVATRLLLNGPPVIVNGSENGGLQWFLIDIPTAGEYTLEYTFGSYYSYYSDIWIRGGDYAPLKRIESYTNHVIFYYHFSAGRYFITVWFGGNYTLHVTNGPIINNFNINHGDAATIFTSVTLNNNCQGDPTEYMASESSDFRNSAWKPYATSPTFALSSGSGPKTVYFKVRNNSGIASTVTSDVIILSTADKILLLNAPLTRGALINSFYSDWYKFTITQRGRYRIETTDYIHLALSGPNSETTLIAEGIPDHNATRIVRDLAPGIYYVKVYQNQYNYALGYFIRLTSDVTISNFTINDGSSVTASRIVTLNNTCLGNPTYYQAGLDALFTNAPWLPYSTHPAFKLNAGNAGKTIFFRVRNADGNPSDVKTFSLTLRENEPLTVNGDWRTGNINPAGEKDWYQFTVASAGTYTIETRTGSLEDTVITLHGPNSLTPILARDDDSGENYGSKIVITLKPGTYTVEVTSHFPSETGTYSIRLKH